ncbi:hypothetical protein [Streptococcus sp. DD12]|uniref:hypothetical protein n=1 Tax=Streptococcus sp. DD12 TaxID=1777880 RepID=UPI0007938BF5|nr:hypothetical protein [Streptococcus sp. DD12]KXT76597.1 hypothetical protein STRDD12_00477 [Streptococcus sp. DD12]
MGITGTKNKKVYNMKNTEWIYNIKGRIIRFLARIGYFQTAVSIVLVIDLLLYNLFNLRIIALKKDNFFNWMILITLLVASVYYIYKYRNSTLNFLSVSDDYKKFVALFRLFNNTFALVIISSVLLRITQIILLTTLNFKFTPQTKDALIGFISLLIVTKMLFSLFALLLDVKFYIAILIFFSLIPVVYFIGIFDLKWWAVITGFLVIWKFINSNDILVLYFKGREIKHIPRRLRYRWKVNELIGYIITSALYVILLISSVFESNNISIEARANIRIYTFLFFSITVSIIFAIVYYILKFCSDKFKLCFLIKVRKTLGKIFPVYTYTKLYNESKKKENTHV